MTSAASFSKINIGSLTPASSVSICPSSHLKNGGSKLKYK